MWHARKYQNVLNGSKIANHHYIKSSLYGANKDREPVYCQQHLQLQWKFAMHSRISRNPQTPDEALIHNHLAMIHIKKISRPNMIHIKKEEKRFTSSKQRQTSVRLPTGKDWCHQKGLEINFTFGISPLSDMLASPSTDDFEAKHPLTQFLSKI